MSPRFTPTQARMVLENAGLDPDKPLTEQLAQQPVGLEQQVAQLTERVSALTSQLEASQPDPARDFAGEYAQALGNARSKWFRPDGSVDDAA